MQRLKQAKTSSEKVHLTRVKTEYRAEQFLARQRPVLDLAGFSSFVRTGGA